MKEYAARALSLAVALQATPALSQPTETPDAAGDDPPSVPGALPSADAPTNDKQAKPKTDSTTANDRNANAKPGSPSPAGEGQPPAAEGATDGQNDERPTASAMETTVGANTVPAKTELEDDAVSGGSDSAQSSGGSGIEDRAGAPATAVGPAHAPVAVSVIVDQVWNTDPGYDFFDDDDVSHRVGVAASFDVLTSAQEITLAAELGLLGESEDAGPFLGGAIDEMSLEGESYFAGLQLRYAVGPWLSPFVHVSGGVTLLDTEVRIQELSRVKENHTLGFAAVSAGLEFLPYYKRLDTSRELFNAIGLGVRAEGGFLTSAPVSIDLQNQDEDARIGISGAPLGELSRSGPFLRFSVFVRL